jgi:hypothetical protein
MNTFGGMMALEKQLKYSGHTIKLDRQLVDELKKISKEEERTLITVTNRLMRFAIKQWKENKDQFENRL